MRIAVVGAGGQLAAAVIQECQPAHEVTTFSRAQLDVSDEAAGLKALTPVRPDVIVNGAAFNDVDAAEDRPVDALTINAFGPRALARTAAALGATLVHYSTDFVFDGKASTPYTETDAPSPRSVYAASKLLGEWFAADAPRAYVLRVESLFGGVAGGPPQRGTVAGICRMLRDGGSPRVFDDRTVSPTFVIDAARATRLLIERNAPSGLYHCVNSGRCTWLELTQELVRLMGIEATLVPVHMADVTLRAARPQYCALSNDKLRALGIEMPPWQDALARFVAMSR